MKKIVITMAVLGLSVPSILAQNTPPTVVCQTPATRECVPVDAPLTLTAQVSDAEGNPLTLVWFVNGTPVKTNNLESATAPPGQTVDHTQVFEAGTYNITVTAADGTAVGECNTTLTVANDQPPAFTNLTASPSVLWPPNKKMRPIRLNLAVSNDCGAVTSRIVSVTSSEPIRGTSAFDRSPDWIIGTNGLSLQLRAERAGNNRAGRTYTITVEVMDAAGSTAQRTVDVTVPHDRRQGLHPSLVKKPKKAKKPKNNNRR